jgi:hypothetical protein
VTKAINGAKTAKGTIAESHPFSVQQKNADCAFSDWKAMMLNASDGEANDAFGFSVSVSGNYAIIGAPWDDNITGAAYIFKHVGTTWIQEAKLTAADGMPEDGFGWSVSLDGNTCVIGAIEDDDNGNRSGSAYIFTCSDTMWTQQAKLLASDGAPHDHFGNSVSINGDHIVIGINIYRDENSTESAYVFERNGTFWMQEAKIVSPDSEPTGFGTSVSIYGDHIIIGAPYFDFLAGAVYIFKHNGTTWSQQAQLKGSDDNPLELFGWAVSISGAYATTIALSFFDLNGSVYIFKRNGTTWSLDAKLTGFTDQFSGLSNVISNTDTCVIVGNCYYNNSIGSAYMFWKPSPQFEITFKGVSTYVKNVGDANATNVTFNRRLEGGLILVGKDKTVIIPSISIGETKEARFGMILGLGKTTITFFLSCDEDVTETRSLQAIVLFFFSLLLK